MPERSTIEGEVRIRACADGELADVLQVQNLAFGPEQGAEIATLVSDILQDPSAAPVLSLVALRDNQIVGHVLFSFARLDVPEQAPTAMIMAPLAVVPDAQNRGIGSDLIRGGLARLDEAGVGLVFVLGHPAYYQRHGFEPAGRRGLQAPHPIPAEHADAWMVLTLREDLLGRSSGKVLCCDALNQARYWRE